MSAPTPARRVAYEVLRRVFEQGAYADRALRSAADRFSLEGRDRALAQRLAYGSVQRRGTCDHLIAALADRPASSIDPPLRAALRLGLFELLFDDGASAHAAVDQAVGLAKGGRDGERRHRGSGLVNAVLRRATREGVELLDGLRHDSPATAAIAFSVPTWIAELWWRERGERRALSLLAAANEAPRRLYRPTGSVSADVLVERLRALGVEFQLLDPELTAGCALLAVTGGEWTAVEAAVRAGELLPQSRGSALAAALLGVREGDRVLDLCAAPGIKTTQLAAAAGRRGRVVAVERDAGRAREIGQLCERVGLDRVEVACGDGTELDLGSGYDRVLVDAPCSGLGTLASRPDLRWRRSEADLAGLADLQSRLLEAGTRALRPGGRAIYAVCTISRAEGEGVVAEALGRDQGLRQLDLSSSSESLVDDRDPRSLQLLPDRDGSDGFFIAGVERVA